MFSSVGVQGSGPLLCYFVGCEVVIIKKTLVENIISRDGVFYTSHLNGFVFFQAIKDNFSIIAFRKKMARNTLSTSCHVSWNFVVLKASAWNLKNIFIRAICILLSFYITTLIDWFNTELSPCILNKYLLLCRQQNIFISSWRRTRLGGVSISTNNFCFVLICESCDAM